MQRRVAMSMAFALVAAACSSSAEPGPTSTSTGSTTSTSATATPSTSTIPSTPPDAEDPALSVVLPIDPDVTIGQLDNGLTYYVRFNDSPGQRVELRLVVDAGSVLEAEDQSGGAHFLEHMMFNGTEKYPANDLIAVLEGFGPQFGPDINAYTNFDETVYELSVPTDNPAVFTEALHVLVQWASHATLAQSDVVDERGVVVEEWRLRDQGIGGRTSAAIVELVLSGTGYEGQEPIGEFDSISTMDSEPLRRFYEDWYRPDLMAVVVVGDIDVADVEDQIVAAFGELATEPGAPGRPVIGVDRPARPGAASLADPEATEPSVDVFYISPVQPGGNSTVGDAQADFATAMALDIVQRRLVDDALRGRVPFYNASSFNSEFTRGARVTGFSVLAEADQLADSARALLVEIGRASQFGFTDEEVDLAREQLSALNEQARDGQDSRQDSQFAADYVANFLDGKPIPSVDQQHSITNEILARLTTVDVEEAFADLVSAAPRLFAVGPDEPVGAVPSPETLVALADEVATLTLEPRPEQSQTPDQLMSAPASVEATALNVNDIFGYLELDYANGARVVFWPTDIAANLVTLEVSSLGGYSQVDVPDLVEAEYGLGAIANSGVGSHDQVTVQRIIADRIVDLRPYMTVTHEGFTGGAAKEDLETLFQLLHLSIAEPRIDPVAVANLLAEERPLVESPEDSPRLLASIALNESYYGDADARHWVVPPVDEFNLFDAERALEVYQERFSNAGEFLFVFVGDADVDTLIALSDTYIGSLDGMASNEGFIDHQPLPTGEQITTVEAGQDDQGLVQLSFTNRLTGQDLEADVTAALLELIGGNRLRDRIREKLSATYSPLLSIDLQLEPDPYVESYVEVSGDPDRLDEIADEVLADIADLRSNGPSDEQLAIAQEQLFREYELVNNPFLAERVIFFEEHAGREITELIDRYDIISTITVADVRAMARIAFPVGSYIEVKLVPAQ